LVGLLHLYTNNKSFQGITKNGKNTMEISLENMDSGIYLVKLFHDGKQEVRKLILE